MHPIAQSIWHFGIWYIVVPMTAFMAALGLLISTICNFKHLLGTSSDSLSIAGMIKRFRDATAHGTLWQFGAFVAAAMLCLGVSYGLAPHNGIAQAHPCKGLNLHRHPGWRHLPMSERFEP